MRRRSLSLANKRYKHKLNNLSPKQAEKLKTIKLLANELMVLHDVNHLKFGFGYGWKYAGKCSSFKITIQLNYALNYPIEDIRNIILHEIAHAILGVGKGHRIEWQNKAKELGVIWMQNYRK